MKTVKNILTIILFGYGANLFAQQAKLDSLIKLNNSYMKEDNRKLEILNKLTFVYYDMQFDSTEKYVDRSIALAEKLNNSSALAEALYNNANLMNRKGNYRKAIKLSEQSLTAAQKANDSKYNFNLNNFHYNSASMYFGKAHYHRAIEHFLLELRYYELLGSKIYQAVENTIYKYGYF